MQSGTSSGQLGAGGAINSAARLVIQNSTFIDNAASVRGGAIFVQVANNNGNRTTSLEALKITGSTFDGNLAQFGAAVAVVSGDATHPTSDTITIDGTTFTENGIPQTGVGSEQGGGLFAQLFGTSLSIDSSAFANNSADSAGGGVYFDGHSGAAATVTDTSFTNNGQYSTQFLTYTAQQGGGMYAQLFDASLTVTGGAFDSNHAIYGGGLYLAASGSSTVTSAVAISGAQIHENTAGDDFDLNSGGGGLWANLADYSSLLIDQAVFEANVIDDDTLGGGLYVKASGAHASVEINHSQIKNHNVAGFGGGVWALLSCLIQFRPVSRTHGLRFHRRGRNQPARRRRSCAHRTHTSTQTSRNLRIYAPHRTATGHGPPAQLPQQLQDAPIPVGMPRFLHGPPLVRVLRQPRGPCTISQKGKS